MTRMTGLDCAVIPLGNPRFPEAFPLGNPRFPEASADVNSKHE